MYNFIYYVYAVIPGFIKRKTSLIDQEHEECTLKIIKVKFKTRFCDPRSYL